jgi:hypothetical protein
MAARTVGPGPHPKQGEKHHPGKIPDFAREIFQNLVKTL